MRVITVLLCLSMSLNVLAQDFKFGKVSKEELQETISPIDSSASAAYLYKYRRSYFNYIQEKGFELVTEVHNRIKIYNQEGFDYATKSVLLLKSGSAVEDLGNLKAYTYNLVDGKIEDTKLSKSGVFNTEKSRYRDETKFTMPNIKEGCVIEYKYIIRSPFWSNVEDYVFQYDIPINKLEASFESPEYFVFKENLKGFLNVVPKKEKNTGKIIFSNKSRSAGTGTTFSQDEVEYTNHVASYNLENIPALKHEPFVNNINNYRSSINYELSSTRFPNSPYKYYSTTWEDVVKSIYESSSFGDQLNKTGYYEADIDAIISSVSDPSKRVALIFDFVKTKVKWNQYYGKYTNDGVRKAYKEQVGNVAEINLMLTSMLKYAGLKAYPVLVSTRDNGVPLFPTREGYNYVVSYVKLATGDVLLDATSKYSVPNVLPYRVLNWQGRVISEHGGSTLLDLYPQEQSRNNITMMLNLNESGDIKGGYRCIKTNHRALSFREDFNEVNKEEYLEKLENKYGGLEISDYQVKNDFNLAKPVMESYKFVKESQADIIGDKIYFGPLFFLKTNENPFKLEKREFPVDFGYPSVTSYKIVINIPEGYNIESVPEPGVYMLPDNLGVFKYNISAKGNTVQLAVDSVINKSIIAPLYYDSLKAYFSQLVEKNTEQIVLTKG